MSHRKLIIGFDGVPHGSLSVVDGELHAEGPEPHALWHHAEAAAHALAHAGDESQMNPDGILDHLAEKLKGRAHAHWDKDADAAADYSPAVEKGLNFRHHKPHPYQASIEWNEDAHPREESAHDGKRPGEFAPKEEGKKSGPSLDDLHAEFERLRDDRSLTVADARTAFKQFESLSRADLSELATRAGYPSLVGEPKG
jgi:hypothetical protein